MQFVSKRAVKGSYSIHAYHDERVRLEYDPETRSWYVFTEHDGKILMSRNTYRRKKAALNYAKVALYDLIEKNKEESLRLAARNSQSQLPPFRQADSRMSRSEALEILGLSSLASKDEIKRKHRELTKAVHPDAGGSNFLMVQINLALDVLR
jgi:hypothetical protein